MAGRKPSKKASTKRRTSRSGAAGKKAPTGSKRAAGARGKSAGTPATRRNKTKTAAKPKARATRATASGRRKAGPKGRQPAASVVVRVPRAVDPRAKPAPASSLEAYQELENVLYLVRDAVEAADSFDEFTRELAARQIPEARVRRICDLTITGDLHLHSSASDGKVPARKLPWVAWAMGLETIAATDHDSVAGCREAFREGMLIGVRVVPGVELSTEQPGLEILAYFPDAGKLFGFLSSRKADRFNKVLARRQQTVHEKTVACLAYVNRWLRRHKVPEDNLITLEEVDRWYAGQKPYFPGTLCVLGLSRLTASQRSTLKISNPRTFNTKVVTPFLRTWDARQTGSKAKSLLKESVAILQSAARAGVPVASFVAHPKELVTKGKMSLGAVRKLLFRLAEEHRLDGLEVACARDTLEDIRYWTQSRDEYNATVTQAKGSRRRKPLLQASHTSDFHVLGPGVATGEITLGFGVLDSRPAFRRGNLRPQMSLGQFMEQLRRRAHENAGG